MPKLKDRDISHWSDKRKLAWIRRELMRSEHYTPAFKRLTVEWFDLDFYARLSTGDLARGSLDGAAVVLDVRAKAEDLHDLWIIQSGINHYRELILKQELLPMDHGK